VSRTLLGIAFTAALALAAERPAAVQGDAVAVGQAAPAFLINTLDGREFTSNFQGHPAYINVFATWCSPCRTELPDVVDQAKKYRDRIVFLLVDEQEQPSAVERFAESLGQDAPVAVDRGQFAATYAVGGLPWNIFIDRHGVVRYIYRGRIPADVLIEQLSKLASS
jgi:thiol-disulfide isomerase/thioredoxin